jgi:type II secretory pathway component PulF
MPVFVYKATNKKGDVFSDTVTAQSRSDAIDDLFSQGLYPSEIKEKTDSVSSGRNLHGKVSRADVEAFTRELGNLLAAGIPLSKALKILSREASKPAVKKQWLAIHDDVANGMNFADALKQWPKSFSSIYIAMVQAGETGGFLEIVLGQIAEFRAREKDLKSKVQSALIYPLILAVLAGLILVFLLVYFIPRFSSIFTEFGGTLPTLTKGIVTASQFLVKYWLFVLGAIILLIVGARNFIQREDGRATLEKWLLKFPLVGKLLARFAFVRFASMLGTLINAGVPLIFALRVAKEAIGNKTLAAAMNDAIEKVQRGVSLSQSLRSCPQLFTGSSIEMISVAEESSKLGQELARLAEVNEKELDRRLKMAVSFAEPLMLFLMAALVGTIVIGMLLPIFNLQELIH